MFTLVLPALADQGEGREAARLAGAIAAGAVPERLPEAARRPVMFVGSEPSAAAAATSTSAPRAARAAKG